MVFLKDNSVGIDKRIEGIQLFLNDNLKGYNLEILGRAERLDKRLILFYKKNDYKDVLFINPSTMGKAFFIDKEISKTDSKKGSKLFTEVEIIFLLDLKKIKPNIIHRADEEVKIEILEVLKRKLKRIDLEVTKGIEALNGFDTDLKDLQPYHFLKFSLELDYNISNDC